MTAMYQQYSARLWWIGEMIWFNVVWGSLVFAHDSFPLLGLLIVVGLIFPAIRRNLPSIAVVAVVGCVVDQSLTLAGVFRFDSPVTTPMIPFWLVLLWVAFAAALHSSIRWIISGPRALSLVGFAVMGPFSYWVAFRAGAYNLPMDLWLSIGVLVIVWSFLSVILTYLVNRGSAANVNA